MKNTGKKFRGIPIYTDPEVPKNTIYMLHDDFRNGNPERNGMIKDVDMNDLDEKLNEILEVVSALSSDHGYYPHEGKTVPAAQNIDEALAQIKQAFKEAGYILPGETLYAMPKGKDLARELAGLEQIVDDGVETMELAPPMMTGQEWCDRFQTTLYNTPGFYPADVGSVDWDSGDVIKAAKKAAGLL